MARGDQEGIDLLTAIKANLPSLQELLQQSSDEWGYEDPIYRFYHQSFKVFALQAQTEAIVGALQALAPQLPLNPWFMDIVKDGTGKSFKLTDNDMWTQTTRSIVEAFFHARYFLEMICKYGNELPSPPQMLPGGWASVLCLYQIR